MLLWDREETVGGKYPTNVDLLIAHTRRGIDRSSS